MSPLKINIVAVTKQKKPAKATVVNLGVSFRHLNDTENTEKPIDEVIPNINPINEALAVFPRAIITIPTVAIIIAIQTLREILSLKNKKPNRAVKKGIAAELTLLSLTEVIGGIFWVWLPWFGINEIPSTNTVIGGFFLFISITYYSLIMRTNRRFIGLN